MTLSKYHANRFSAQGVPSNVEGWFETLDGKKFANAFDKLGSDECAAADTTADLKIG